MAIDPHDFLAVDGLLSTEERDIRDTVRAFAAAELAPHVADWYDAGTLPDDLGPKLGALGLLGMHLEGYGCAGMSATAYGIACRELEAVDSGLRSFVSVQGSLAMYAIHRWGTEQHREEWLPRMATGEVLGCFGLTEPDAGSDPASMRTRAKRDGDDWVLNGGKMWITNGTLAGVAVVWAQTDDGIRGFVVPTDTPGFTATKIQRKLSLRASVTAELSFDDLRLPGDAVFPDVRGLKGPLSCLNEARYGILWGAVGAARACYEEALAYSLERSQFGKPLASFQLSQKKLAEMVIAINNASLAAIQIGRLKDAGTLEPGAGVLRQARQRARGARRLPQRADHARRRRHHAGPLGHAAHEQPRDGDDLRGHRGDAHAEHRRRGHRDPRLPLTGPSGPLDRSRRAMARARRAGVGLGGGVPPGAGLEQLSCASRPYVCSSPSSPCSPRWSVRSPPSARPRPLRRAPVTWTVQVGSQASNEAVQGMRFLPGDVTIDAGDTVRWVARSTEIHTVTFFPGGGPQSTLPEFDPADLTQLTRQGGSVYDPMQGFNSGLMTTVPTNGDVGPLPKVPHVQTYSLTFPTAGTFTYYCLVHGKMMVGVVHVQPAATPYPYTQAQYDDQARVARAGLAVIGRHLRP